MMSNLSLIFDRLQTKVSNGELTTEQANAIYEKASEKYAENEAEILQKFVNGEELTKGELDTVRARIAELTGGAGDDKGDGKECDDKECDDKKSGKKDDDGDDDNDDDEKEIPEELKEYATELKVRAYEMADIGLVTESQKTKILKVLKEFNL